MQACEYLDDASFLGKLLDEHTPFTIYFCIREVGRGNWRVVRDCPKPYHVLYVPENIPIVGKVSGEPVVFRPGQAVWIQPGELWELSPANETQEFSLGICRFDLRVDYPPRLREPFRVGRTTVGDVLLEELLPGHEIDARLEPLRQRAVLARILCQTFFVPPVVETDRAGGGGLSARVRAQVLSYMIRHVSERFTVRDLAANVRMNPDYFSRQFRVSFGASPKRAIMEMRIRAAGNHLRMSGDTVSETASRFGYSDVFLFSRQFKDVYGVSPSAWLAGSAARR